MKRDPLRRHHHRISVLVESLELRRLLAASAVEFSAAAYSGTQASGFVQFEVTRTGDLSTTQTIDFSTSDGTAVSGTDYQSDQFTVTFIPGASVRDYVVELVNAGASATPTKSFGLNLSNPTGGLTLGDPSTATVTIDEPAAVTATTTTVTAATNGGGDPVTGPLSVGSYVMFTADVVRTGLGVANPTGTVTFSIDGVAQSPIILTTLGDSPTADAVFFTNSLPVGPHTITAAYSGDPSATASMGSTTVTIAQASTISLVTSPLSTPMGQPITLTASVLASDPTAGTPTGTVQFDIYSGSGYYGNGDPVPIEETATVTLVPSATTPGLATATYTTSDLSQAFHEVFATYNGDASFAPQTGDDITTVTGADQFTTTTLAASPNPSVAGQPVTLTAMVTANSAFAPLVGYDSQTEGYEPAIVTFTIDGVEQTPVALTMSPTNPLQGIAQLTTGPLSAGSHTITAVFFDGSNAYNAASTGTLTLQTGEATASGSFVPTQTIIAATPSIPTAGQPYVVIATVTGVGPLPTAPPTGTAEFFDGGVLVAILPLDSLGQAALYIPSLTAGPHSFTVVYGGDANDGISLGVVAPSIVAVQRASAGNTAALVLSIGGGPLDPISARNVKNYQITGSLSQKIKVRSATYNATAATVTLHLASPLKLRSTYQLRVIGTGPSGVRGTNASLLAGVGVAGTDYQAVINSSTPVRSQVRARTTTAHPQARLAAEHHVAARAAHFRIGK